MTAYELSYVLVIVILLYRTVYNLNIFRRSDGHRFLLYFALTLVSFALYLLLGLRTINVPTAASALVYERVENSVLPLMAACFLLFAQSFRPVFSVLVLRVLLGMFAVFSLVILLHPGAYVAELSAPKHFPWLGVTIYETEQPPVVIIFFILMLVVLTRVLTKYVFEDSLHKTKSRFLVLALGLVFLTAIIDISVAARILHFPYTAHFGILAVLFAVEHLFTFEIRYNPELAPQVREAAKQAAVEAERPFQGDPEAVPIHIRCLGPLHIFVGGKEVPFTSFSRKKKLLRLLKMLLLRYGRWLHREEVLEQLWPELGQKGALNNLHALAFRLRKVLGHNEALIFAEDRLFLNRHLVQVDASRFEEQLDSAETAFSSGDREKALSVMGRAEEIYQGDFFEFDPYFEGADLMRDHLKGRFRRNLLRLCGLLEDSGQFEEMVRYAQKAVHLDEVDEESWRTFFLGLQKAGRKNEALKQFEELKKVLVREVDAEPDGETLDVIRSIRAGNEDDED